MLSPLSTFLFYIIKCSISLPVWCGRGFQFVRAPGTRVLPGYKPTNGVLTAAALLHCRRAETNRIQSLRCAHLPFLSALSVCAFKKKKKISGKTENGSAITNYTLSNHHDTNVVLHRGMNAAGFPSAYLLPCKDSDTAVTTTFISQSLFLKCGYLPKPKMRLDTFTL